MSEILSEVVEEVYKKKRKLTGIRCDVCDNIIHAGKYCTDENEYYRVMTGHHDWGNDSCESIEHLDICPRCIDKFVTDYLKNEDYDSAYIDINREHVYLTDRWE